MARVMTRAEWVLLLALTRLWSESFLFAKVALAEVRPLTVVLARVGIAATALMAFMACTGERLAASRGASLISTAAAYVLYFRILATAGQPTFCSSHC